LPCTISTANKPPALLFYVFPTANTSEQTELLWLSRYRLNRYAGELHFNESTINKHGIDSYPQGILFEIIADIKCRIQGSMQATYEANNIQHFARDDRRIRESSQSLSYVALSFRKSEKGLLQDN
jgi:hypothetical protein